MTPETSTPEVPKRTFADSAVSIAAWMAVASAVAFLLSVVTTAAHSRQMTLVAGAALLLSLAGLIVSVVAFFATALSRGRVSALGPSLSFVICVLLGAMSGSMLGDPHGRERAPQSKSASNIRQLALAVQQYANDYDGAFPGWLNVGTKQTPRYVHNVWDRQIDPLVKSQDIYFPADPKRSGPGVRSPSSGQRVLGYALNGALIARYDNGKCDWTQPEVKTVAMLSNPANTILFAEVVTKQPMGGMYADPGVPGPPQGPVSGEWTKAVTQWLDIDPKAWVETSGPVDSYEPGKWDATRGIARDLTGGGGVYACCDGHVQFNKLPKTTTSGQNIDPWKNWSPDTDTSVFNQWMAQ